MIKANAVGRLGNDAELRTVKDGVVVANFSIACNRQEKGVTKTIWVRGSIWGKEAEELAPMLTKGALVNAEGDLTTREWQRNDGITAVDVCMRVNKVELIESIPGVSEPTFENVFQPEEPKTNMADIH
jgi:single-strand DNA-binding protein